MPNSGNPTWQDSPSTVTPINAAALNALETAVKAAAPVSSAWTASTAVKAGQLLTNAGVLYSVNADMTTPSSFATTGLTAVGGGGSTTLPALIRAVTVAFAATVTPDASAQDILNIGALTANITIANPTGTPVDGQSLRLRMSQDATGSRTVSFGTAFAFGTDVPASTIPATASAKWELLFLWNAADSKWRAAAIIRGF